MAWFKRKAHLATLDGLQALLKKDNPAQDAAARVMEQLPLLRQQGWVNDYSSDGLTLLHCAVASSKPGMLELVQALLDAGADPLKPWESTRNTYAFPPERAPPYAHAVMAQGHAPVTHLLRSVTGMAPEAQAWLWCFVLATSDSARASRIEALYAHGISPEAPVAETVIWAQAQVGDLARLRHHFPQLPLDALNGKQENAIIEEMRKWSTPDWTDQDMLHSVAKVTWMLDAGMNLRQVNAKGVGAVIQGIFSLGRRPDFIRHGVPVIQRLVDNGAPWCVGKPSVYGPTRLIGIAHGYQTNTALKPGIMGVLHALDWPLSVWTKPSRHGHNWANLCEEFPTLADRTWRRSQAMEVKVALDEVVPTSTALPPPRVRV